MPLIAAVRLLMLIWRVIDMLLFCLMRVVERALERAALRVTFAIMLLLAF